MAYDRIMSKTAAESGTDSLVGPDLRRELELAGDSVSSAAHELRREMRASHIGDDWMDEGV
jgi:hypothetical protein